jgi:hypothetical protein
MTGYEIHEAEHQAYPSSWVVQGVRLDRTGGTRDFFFGGETQHPTDAVRLRLRLPQGAAITGRSDRLPEAIDIPTLEDQECARLLYHEPS